MIPEREDAMTTMTTYKKAIAKLATSNRPVIISNETVILLKVNNDYTLVRNDLEKLQQTRYKTVNSIQELEDKWMNENEAVEYKEFEDEDEAVFYFSLMEIAATHRDIVL